MVKDSFVNSSRRPLRRRFISRGIHRANDRQPIIRDLHFGGITQPPFIFRLGDICCHIVSFKIYRSQCECEWKCQCQCHSGRGWICGHTVGRCGSWPNGRFGSLDGSRMRSPSASRRSVDEEGQCRSYLTQDVYVEVEAFVARLRWVCHLPLTVGRAGGNARKSVACHVASTSTGQAAAISLRWTSTYPLQCSRYYNVPYFPSPVR